MDGVKLYFRESFPTRPEIINAGIILRIIAGGREYRAHPPPPSTHPHTHTSLATLEL